MCAREVSNGALVHQISSVNYFRAPCILVSVFSISLPFISLLPDRWQSTNVNEITYVSKDALCISSQITDK